MTSNGRGYCSLTRRLYWRRYCYSFTTLLLVSLPSESFGHSSRARQRRTQGTAGNISFKSSTDAFVSTGPDLAHAFANSAIEFIWVTTPLLDVANADWSAYNEPVLLTRNVTVSGHPKFTDWPILRINYVKHKVRLDHNKTLAFKNLVIDRGRSDHPTRVPGIDLVAPTLAPNTSRLLLGPGLATMHACLPPYLQKQNVVSAGRPDAYPGQQLTNIDVPQGGCTNSSNASYMHRCWPSRTEHMDIVFNGADSSASGAPVPSNIFVVLQNMTSVCEEIVTQKCIDESTAMLCLMRAIQAAVNRNMAAAASASPTSRSGTTSGTAGGSSWSTERVVGAAVGSVAGACALVVLVGLVAVRWLSVSRQRQRKGGARNGVDREPASAAAAHDAGASHHTKVQQLEAESDTGQTSGEVTLPVDVFKCDAPQPIKNEDVPVTHLTPVRVSLQLEVQMKPAGEPQGGARSAGSGGGGVTHSSSCGGSADMLLTVRNLTNKATVTLLPIVRGKGAFGRVQEGLYRGVPVAVKLLAEVHACAGEPLGAAVCSFRQEVEVLGRCQHPNVVRLLAACLTPPRLCLVMELMEASLEQLMYGSHPHVLLPLSKVLHIGISVARALAYLHPTIVHRDIKPANVLINKPTADKPIVKVTDFGLSRLRITVAPTKHPDAGTPPYMAPECFDTNNKIITHQMDIYALGILLWEMLAGIKPWAGTDFVAIAFQVCQYKLRPPVTVLGPERCPPKLRRLLQSCWEEVPARRPAAAEIAKELTVILQAHDLMQQLMEQGPLAELGEQQGSESAAQQHEKQRHGATKSLLPLPPMSQPLFCTAQGGRNAKSKAIEATAAAAADAVEGCGKGNPLQRQPADAGALQPWP